MARYLEEGEVVGIFPEGRLTDDGEIGVFKAGIERIIQRTPVPVVPMALRGPGGSFFSRRYGGKTDGGSAAPVLVTDRTGSR